MTTYLTLVQAAERAGLEHTAALRKAILRGRLPAQKLAPRLWVVTQHDLDAYLATRPGGLFRKPTPPRRLASKIATEV